MNASSLNLPHNQPRTFLLIATVLWFGLYKTLEPLSHILMDVLPVDCTSHFTIAMQRPLHLISPYCQCADQDTG